MNHFDARALITPAKALQAAFPTVSAGADRFTRTFDVFVIPQGSEPRWIILGRPCDAVPVLRSWSPYNLRSKLRWSGVLVAASRNMLARLPGVITDRTELDLGYWRERLPGFSANWTPVLHVGNSSHTRKIILFFVDEGGAFRAVGKAPLLPAASDAILNEWRVLGEIQGKISAPAPLFGDADRGVAAQKWLEGRPVSRDLTRAHLDFLLSLRRPGSTVSLAPWRDRLRQQLKSVSMDRKLVDRALDRVDFPGPLPAMIEHRDFAPWNLKRLANGRTAAIDWEWAVLDGLPCLDLFRWFYIQDALFGGKGNVWNEIFRHPLTLDYIRRAEVPEPALPALVALYLLRAIVTDAEAGSTTLVEHSSRQLLLLLST